MSMDDIEFEDLDNAYIDEPSGLFDFENVKDSTVTCSRLSCGTMENSTVTAETVNFLSASSCHIESGFVSGPDLDNCSYVKATTLHVNKITGCGDVEFFDYKGTFLDALNVHAGKDFYGDEVSVESMSVVGDTYAKKLKVSSGVFNGNVTVDGTFTVGRGSVGGDLRAKNLNVTHHLEVGGDLYIDTSSEDTLKNVKVSGKIVKAASGVFYSLKGVSVAPQKSKVVAKKELSSAIVESPLVNPRMRRVMMAGLSLAVLGNLISMLNVPELGNLGKGVCYFGMAILVGFACNVGPKAFRRSETKVVVVNKRLALVEGPNAARNTFQKLRGTGFSDSSIDKILNFYDKMKAHNSDLANKMEVFMLKKNITNYDILALEESLPDFERQFQAEKSLELESSRESVRRVLGEADSF